MNFRSYIIIYRAFCTGGDHKIPQVCSTRGPFQKWSHFSEINLCMCSSVRPVCQDVVCGWSYLLVSLQLSNNSCHLHRQVDTQSKNTKLARLTANGICTQQVHKATYCTLRQIGTQVYLTLPERLKKCLMFFAICKNKHHWNFYIFLDLMYNIIPKASCMSP